MQQSEITCTYIVSEERIDCEDKLYLDMIILYIPGIYVYKRMTEFLTEMHTLCTNHGWLNAIWTQYVIIFWSGERISSKNNTI